MPGRTVYVVYGEGEDTLAQALVQPLSEAGYHVAHHGTVMVGESLVGEAGRALASDAPIVLCATTRAVGSAWAHQIARAAQAGGRVRVFVVQMEQQAYVEQLALQAKVARFWEDPARAIRDLLEALAKHFPPHVQKVPPQAPDERPADGRQYLDHPADGAVLDFSALLRFRGQLREEVADQFPAALTAVEFLDRAGLRIEGHLTRTGALLFAEEPTGTNPTAMVKCTRYYGPDRAAARETLTFTGTVPDQVLRALDFVASRVRAGHAPIPGQAQSADVYHYPMVAVREIIANALAHRDYKADDRCVHLRLFPERMEVSSPGRWLSCDIEDGVEHPLASLEGQSIKRNFRLAHVLSWIRLVEGEGSGIPSALRDCRSTHSPEPTVVQNQGFVTVVLRRRDPHLGTSMQQVLVPISIPRDIDHFVGRASTLAMLDSALRDAAEGGTAGPRINVITGMAGVGKTALAVHWAHRVSDRFPDGVLYAHLHSGTPDRPFAAPAETMRGFLQAFGIPPDRIPAEFDAMTALYRSLLHDRRVLLLLDDAGSADQVRPLIPSGPACTLVVTSRSRLTGLTAQYAAHALPLDLLSGQEAIELLARRLGRERIEAEPEAVKALIDRCARLPLALALVAARAAHHPGRSLSDLVGEFDAADRLRILSLDDDATSMRTVFSSAYRALSAPAATMFRLLGVHPGPDIGLSEAAALAGLDLASAQRSLDELVRQSLLDESAPHRYRAHDLLRAYAAELARLEPEDFASEATGRVADYYVHTGIDAAKLLNPHRESITPRPPDPGVAPEPIGDYEQAMGWFSAVEPILPEIIEKAAQLGFYRRAWELAWAIAPFLDVRRHWKTLINSQTTALAAAESHGDVAAQAASHRLLGRAYSHIDSDDAAVAHQQRALALLRKLGDLGGQANTLYDLAEIRQLRRQYDEAIDDALNAVNLYKRAGNSAGALDALQLAWAAADSRGSGDDSASGRSPHTTVFPPTAAQEPIPHLTIFVADVVGFGDHSRTDRERISTRAALYQTLYSAFSEVGIPLGRCYREDRGDGVFVAVPPDVPKHVFAAALPHALVAELRKHNRSHPAATQLRLRVALHAGPLHHDDHGASGAALNHAFRLLDAPAFKTALSESHQAFLALIISDWFYREVIQESGGADLDMFHRVDVSIKETSTTAWIRLVDSL